MADVEEGGAVVEIDEEEEVEFREEEDNREVVLRDGLPALPAGGSDRFVCFWGGDREEGRKRKRKRIGLNKQTNKILPIYS